VRLGGGEVIRGRDVREMWGSILQSDEPIAFVGGSGYLCMHSKTSLLPNDISGGCDASHQLVPPVGALGNDYAIAPYETRRKDMQPESIAYRIAGVAKGTSLTYDPPIAGAPASLTLGQVVDFEAVGAFRVKSQDANHPFHLAQFMTGCWVQSGSRAGCSFTGPNDDPNNPCLGDE